MRRRSITCPGREKFGPYNIVDAIAGRAQICLLLALAEHRLGRVGSACRALADAEQLIAGRNQELERRSSPIREPWREWEIATILRREAVAEIDDADLPENPFQSIEDRGGDAQKRLEAPRGSSPEPSREVTELPRADGDGG